MKLASFLFKIALFILLFAFAMGNQHPVQIVLLPEAHITLPLVVLVLLCLLLGVVLTLVLLLPARWRQHRLLKQALQASPAHPATPADSQPGQQPDAPHPIRPIRPD